MGGNGRSFKQCSIRYSTNAIKSIWNILGLQCLEVRLTKFKVRCSLERAAHMCTVRLSDLENTTPKVARDPMTSRSDSSSW